MNARWLAVVMAVVASAFLASAQGRQTAAQLYQSGVYAEEIEGNLQKAIGIFEQVLRQFPSDRDPAANAQLHIGLCYEKLGVEKSREAFEKVIKNYPGQTEAVAQARAKLDAILRLTSASRKGETEVTVRRVPTLDGTTAFSAVSPDGKYLANFAASVKDCDVWISDTSTGKQRFLTTEGREKGCKEVARSPRWSRDSTKLVYAWGLPPVAQLRVVALDGSAPRVLVPKAGGYWIDALDWSTDGSTILALVFYTDKQELVLVSVADGSVRSLNTFAGPNSLDQFGRFSPDGRYVAYSRPTGKGGNAERWRDIFVLPVDGGPERPLVQHPSDDVLLDWLPGERGVLFVSERAGTMDVWSLPIEEGRPQGAPRLVRRSIGPITPFGLTRDGALYYKTPGSSKDVYTVSLDPKTGNIAGPPTKEPLPWEGHNEYPAWSPDGKRLAYHSTRPAIRASEYMVCVYSVDTSSVREYRDERIFMRPQWSLDGRSLFVMATNLDDGGMYRVDVENGEVTKFSAKGAGRTLAVSIDGRWIVRGLSDKAGTPIVRRNAATGEERDLDRTPLNVLIPLAFSRDGSRLAWAIQLDKQTKVLKVMPFPDGTPTEIRRFTETPGPSEIAWSPDGRFIYYDDRVTAGGSEPHLWRIPAAGGTAQDLGSWVSRFASLNVHPDGSRITFSANTIDPERSQVWVWENFLPSVTKAGGVRR